MLKGATQVQYTERLGLVALLESGLVKDWSVAIDGGAHVGTWSELMSPAFEIVHAFEPSPAFDYLAENASAWSNVETHHAALTDDLCQIETFHRKSIGKLTSRRVRKVDGDGLPGVTIDSLALERCGLIKLDVEGFEYLALTGARETIARCRPFILVEMAGHGGHTGHTDDDVSKLLADFGYRAVWAYHVDQGFAPIEGGHA